MILTVLEAQVPLGKEAALQAAYAAAAKELPAGLVRSELLRDARDATRWRIQTWWSSREALDAMRSTGTPAGVLMFRAANAEPTLSVFEVVNTLPSAALDQPG
jgi:heme-degrading monooxygenase HmoA